jgi:hypothetical protein
LFPELREKRFGIYFEMNVTYPQKLTKIIKFEIQLLWILNVLPNAKEVFGKSIKNS